MMVPDYWIPLGLMLGLTLGNFIALGWLWLKDRRKRR